LQEQSNCPFRAFAIRRLRADGPKGPRDELDAATRGQIVDRALKRIWDQLGNSEGLLRDDLEAVISQGVEHAMAEVLPDTSDAMALRLRELERQRNIEVLGGWLRLEATRRPFKVLAHQQEVEVELGGLRLRGQLDRLDEINGEQLVIDYKTGKGIGVGAWAVPRPRQPQLPFYALALRRRGTEPAGIAYATVRRDDCSFKAYQREHGLVPSRPPKKEHFDGAPFERYMNLWEEELERLARSFIAGEAAVDPIIPPGKNASPCRSCHLQALCRVGDERVAEADNGGEEESDE